MMRIMPWSRDSEVEAGCRPPQVGWTTVFFWEYFGPLLTYSFIYFFPQYIYFGHRCADPSCPRHSADSQQFHVQLCVSTGLTRPCCPAHNCCLVCCSSLPEKGVVQQTALRYWCFHYLKRIGETFFLHRYLLDSSSYLLNTIFPLSPVCRT